MLISHRDFLDTLVRLSRDGIPDDRQECSICKMRFYSPDNSEEVSPYNPVRLRCGHVFCDHCIFRWTTIHETNCRRCPECRSVLWGPSEEEVETLTPIHHFSYYFIENGVEMSEHAVAANRHYLQPLEYHSMKDVFSQVIPTNRRILVVLSMRDSSIMKESSILPYWKNGLMRARIPLPDTPAAKEFRTDAPFTNVASAKQMLHQMCWRAIIQSTHEVLPIENRKSKDAEYFPDDIFRELLDASTCRLHEILVYWQLSSPEYGLEKEFGDYYRDLECMMYDEIATVVYFLFYTERLDKAWTRRMRFRANEQRSDGESENNSGAEPGASGEGQAAGVQQGRIGSLFR